MVVGSGEDPPRKGTADMSNCRQCGTKLDGDDHGARGWNVDGVVTGMECDDCGDDYRTSSAYGVTRCRKCWARADAYGD